MDKTQTQLTMVIPTLNEAGNIDPLCRRILQAVPGTQIIVVDDNSKDATQDVVRQMIAEGLPVQLIARTEKPCLTDSIEAGVRAARTDYVGWMDADLSHPPELITELLARAKTNDCSIATRFAKGGSYKKHTKDTPDSPLATLLSVIMNFIVKRWLNLTVSDYTSGFIVCKRELLATHDFVGDYGEYFIEIVYFLSRRNVNIYEVPYSSPPRKWGESKTGPNLKVLMARGVKYIWTAIRLKLPRTLFGKLSLQQKTRSMI